MSVCPLALTKVQSVWLLAAAMPVAFTQFARLVDHLGPSNAGAAPTSMSAQAVAMNTETPAAPTAVQGRAMAWVAAHREMEYEINPFAKVWAKAAVSSAPVQEPAATLPSRDADPVAPEIKISGFIGKGETAMVTINRRIRRVGDEVGPGWRLKGIDALSRVVHIEHTSGFVLEVSASGKEK